MKTTLPRKTSPSGHLILPEEFKSKGFIYRQLLREGDHAIFSQMNLSYPNAPVRFEVITIRRHNGYRIAGQKIPPAEMYPHPNQWGSLAWTLTSIEDAQAKLKKVQEIAPKQDEQVFLNLTPEEIEAEHEEEPQA